MKQLSLLAAVLVVAACSEAPTAPGATAASPSEVAQMAPRTAGLTAVEGYCSTSATSWVIAGTAGSATVSGCIGFDPSGSSSQTLTFSVSDGTNSLQWNGPGFFTFTPGFPAGTLDFTNGFDDFHLYLTGVSGVDIPPQSIGIGSFLTFYASNSVEVGDITITSLTLPPGASTAPQTKEQCKNGGWIGFYKNQGQCVSEKSKKKP